MASRARERPRGRKAAAPLVVLALLLASPALADRWYEHYEKAERALDDGDWAEALSQAMQAAEKRPEPGVKVQTYGMNFVDYFPYLTMGIAHYELGRADAALTAFDTEEQLGAVARSTEQRTRLEGYRQRIRDDQARAEAEIAQRKQQHVADSLARAAALESEDRLDDAIAALGQILAVEPEHPEATAAMQRISAELSQRQQQQADQQRVAQLVEEGRALLAESQYQEAAARFSQALTLQPDPATQQLYDDAQGKLRAGIAARQDEQQLRQTITDGIARARQFESDGQLVAALDQVETVLALDPGNAAARELRQRIQRFQSEQAADQLRQSSVEDLLARAARLHEAGDYQGALTAALRLRAIEPGNTEVMRYITSAFTRIARDVTGQGPAPPQIAFVNQPETLPDGSLLERVASPQFVLRGSVVSSSPVRIEARPQLDGVPAPEVAVDVEQHPNFVLSNFTITQRLDPGKAELLVAAEDESNQLTTSGYAVLYAVPWFRQTLVQLGLGVGVLALVGGAWGVRANRRRRLRRRKFNPYIAGAPILKENLFFGRERLLGRVLQTVHNNSILLYGERRIGKTSFQHHLKRRLTDMDDPNIRFFPVFVDLQGTPQERFFATLGQDLFEELRPLLDGLEPDPKLDDPESYDYRTFVADLKRVLKVLATKTPKEVKVVLQIDEVDELNRYDPKVNQKLRSLFMRSFAENLVAVVSGVGIQKHWDSEGSPWYNFFEEIEVQPFRREDAKELIERPIRGIFKLESGVVDRIIDLGECKPYVIQKICIRLIDRLHHEGRRVATLADVDEVNESQASGGLKVVAAAEGGR